jgi:2-polyprenyl-6-methoxyphenol hydroxylase-like FAD-dependent oxidoreductase
MAVAARSRSVWIARHGRIVEKRPDDQLGAVYADMVNAMRAAVGGSARRIVGKVADAVVTSERQTVGLATGEEISARLVIMANGLNSTLRRNLGFDRREISPHHCISIGFDVKPVDRPAFDFDALTYYPEHLRERIAYLTLFPVKGGMRANLFVYRDLHDPWLAALRRAPVATLLAAMPGLTRIAGPLSVDGFVHIRPVDLYRTTGLDQPGVVLVGDAFATSCPAAATGLSKVLTDVERLCHVHIPAWLATPAMGRDKIAAFYADPAKRACDAWAFGRAEYVRAISVDSGIAWQARRQIRFAGQLGLGALRAARERLTGAGRPRAAAGTTP